MANKLQALRFRSAQRVQRLTESQIAETNFIENIKRIGKSFLFADLREELDRFMNGEIEHVVNRFAFDFDFQHVRLETFSFALGAAHIKIAQELHLDLFESRS